RLMRQSLTKRRLPSTRRSSASRAGIIGADCRSGSVDPGALVHLLPRLRLDARATPCPAPATVPAAADAGPGLREEAPGGGPVESAHGKEVQHGDDRAEVA